MLTKNLSKICIKPSDSIKRALDVLSENKPSKTNLPGGIILVTDQKKKLLGIATDGDIRRAISRGSSLSTPITGVMNNAPFTIEGPKSNLEILSIVVDKTRSENWHKDRLDKIIIVDKDKRLVDIVSFYDLWRACDVRFKHVGVVGLGYVGLTLALTLADLGFTVRGFDKNPDVIAKLKKGTAHFYEEGLEALLKDHSEKNFKVVGDFSMANNCDIYFVAVGTPLRKNNKPDMSYLEDASEKLGKILKHGDVVILRSTVPVGSTRNVIKPLLEKYSGLTAGEGFLLAFAPERTVEGMALKELRTLPQVIGGLNRASSDITSNIFSFMTNSTVVVDTLEEAEMVKLVNNTYRDVTFAFANEVSLVAQRWGLDAKRIIEAANYGYERSRVPTPSPGVGGYCLEKDPFIFIESARAKNYEPLMFKHARAVSEKMIRFVADEVTSFLKKQKKTAKDPKILIMGFAFKGRPLTSDTRGSPTLKLVQHLHKNNYKNLHGYDPAVVASTIQSSGVMPVSNIKNGFQGADAVVVMNNNVHFENMDIRSLINVSSKPTLLFDSWGLYKKEEVLKVDGINYRRL